MSPRNTFMTEEIADRSIDLYFQNLAKDITTPWIFFDGGEPLLNFKVLKFAVEYARRFHPNTKFSFNTNGTLINEEKAKWLADNKIDVTFSIDGTKEVNDKNRVFRNGKGSYDRIIKGLENYKKYSGNGLKVKTSIEKGGS